MKIFFLRILFFVLLFHYGTSFGIMSPISAAYNLGCFNDLSMPVPPIGQAPPPGTVIGQCQFFVSSLVTGAGYVIPGFEDPYTGQQMPFSAGDVTGLFLGTKVYSSDRDWKLWSMSSEPGFGDGFLFRANYVVGGGGIVTICVQLQSGVLVCLGGDVVPGNGLQRLARGGGGAFLGFQIYGDTFFSLESNLSIDNLNPGKGMLMPLNMPKDSLATFQQCDSGVCETATRWVLRKDLGSWLDGYNPPGELVRLGDVATVALCVSPKGTTGWDCPFSQAFTGDTIMLPEPFNFGDRVAVIFIFNYGRTMVLDFMNALGVLTMHDYQIWTLMPTTVSLGGYEFHPLEFGVNTYHPPDTLVSPWN